MSVYTWFVANAAFPIHEWLKGHDTVRVRKALEHSQWLSPDALRELQLRRLRALLQSVKSNVPYYRDLFEKLAFDPTNVLGLSDLQKLPFLTKPIIRQYQESLKANNAHGLSRFNTGGSSGEPLIFFIGNERVSHDVAAKWRATRWWDVDIGDKEIVVWGSPIELGAQDYVRMIRDKLLRTRLIPAFEMSEANLDRFVREIKDFKPKMLFGYPSSLSLIAAHAEKMGQNMRGLGIKTAFVTSERLYDHQREKIQSVFACAVANGYGGRDAGFIAHQCPRGGMHITAEDIIVETVDGEGRNVPVGTAGELVITHLATKDFPFIRYKTGDVAILDDGVCACGRGLPMLREIQGRTTDFVVTANGTIMHGLGLIYVLRDNPAVSAFKIIQESTQLTRIEYVPGTAFSANQLSVMTAQLKKRLGDAVEIQWSEVTEIAREKSGKFRYVVSKVVIPHTSKSNE